MSVVIHEFATLHFWSILLTLGAMGLVAVGLYILGTILEFLGIG